MIQLPKIDAVKAAEIIKSFIKVKVEEANGVSMREGSWKR